MSGELNVASGSNARAFAAQPHDGRVDALDVDLRKIKLIVWDLDETLWQGTLSEEGVVPVAENIKLVIDLSKRGIINSVCSKNDLEPAMKKLAEHGLADYFVFCSVDWTPKGERIKSIVDNMNLRYENVLFIDDNISNLKEAEFSCPKLMTALPTVIDRLIEAAPELGKNDSSLERLQQYKQLEEKHVKKSSFSSNHDFLLDSEIRVDIHRDTLGNEDRLYELITRTNQLNFTKKRDSLEEFQHLLKSPDIDAGYVTASDKYGDYGIVGFFAVEKQSLVHFAFSCRTIGMGVEQFVYDELKSPVIEIIAPVSGSLVAGERPAWINRVESAVKKTERTDTISAKVMFKGPCDLQSLVPMLKVNDIDAELVHVDDHGRQVEIQCATQNIVNSRTLSRDDLAYLRDVMPFYEDEVFQTKIFDGNYDVVVMSILSDFNFGVYENKARGIKVALGQNFRDITSADNWRDYIDGKIYNGRYELSTAQLERFAKDFQKVDYGPDSIVENVRFIRSKIDSSVKLVLMLGAEQEIEKHAVGNYVGRASFHKQVNDKLKKIFSGDKSIVFIEPSKYIAGADDFIDQINHYSKRVMFNLAGEISAVLSDLGVSVRTRSSTEVMAGKLFRKLRNTLPGLKHSN
jgi:FkbH-like protein